MGDEAPFDLNEAIRKWREDLERTACFRPEELEELELHLRDSVAVLKSGEVPEVEAWWLARNRLGGDEALQKEFGKVNRLARRIATLFGEVATKGQFLHRVGVMERNLFLPIKAAAIAMLLYAIYSNKWFDTITGLLELGGATIPSFLWFYLGINLLGAGLLLCAHRLPFVVVRWTVFMMNLIDGAALTALIFIIDDTGLLFWLFLGMIFRNAISVPGVGLRLLLNLGLIGGYAVAGSIRIGLTGALDETSRFLLGLAQRADGRAVLLLQVAILGLFTGCCCGVQFLVNRRGSKQLSLI